MPDVPTPVHDQLYCQRCCLDQPTRQVGKQLSCGFCGSVLQPPQDPEACPRSPDGRHNPYRVQGGYICSRCNVQMAQPDEYLYLGGNR